VARERGIDPIWWVEAIEDRIRRGPKVAGTALKWTFASPNRTQDRGAATFTPCLRVVATRFETIRRIHGFERQAVYGTPRGRSGFSEESPAVEMGDSRRQVRPAVILQGQEAEPWQYGEIQDPAAGTSPQRSCLVQARGRNTERIVGCGCWRSDPAVRKEKRSGPAKLP